MRSALVTGASGFIGQAMCRALAARHVAVTALHRHPRQGPWSREVLHDLAEGPPPAAALEGVDSVFHLAGHAHAEDAPGSDDVHLRVTVDGTRNLLDACGLSVQRILYMSSIKAMGESTPAAGVDESAPSRPSTAYGRTRLQAEGLVLAPGARRHAVVLRLPLVYGPAVRGNLARMIRSLERGRMPMLPDFGNRRSMVHVDDVCAAAIAAITTPVCSGRFYYVTDGRPYAPREIQLLICAALGRRAGSAAVPLWALRAAAAAGDVLKTLGLASVPLDSQALQRLSSCAVFHAHRAHEDFGFVPRRHLDDSLPEMVRGLRADGSC